MTTSETSYDNIRAKIADLIRNKLFHPEKDNAQLARLSEEFVDLWPAWLANGDIEAGVNDWLRKLKLSHTAFWRGPGTGLPAYFAINATLKRITDGRLVFWDVLPGGLAERAGINPGDVMAGINGQGINGDEPRFQLGSTYTMSVTRNGTEKTATISLPRYGPKDRPPMTEAKPLTYSVKDRIAVLKVTSFPGAVGFDLLCDLKNALTVFDDKKCNRLVLDLRSNCGGGLSSVRLMSLLVPDRRFIGYSLTRLGRDRKRSAAQLPAIRRLPGSKLGLLPLAIRFKLVNRDRSFRLFTEGLGSRSFHGSVAVLVDEYTRSAAEMIAAFVCNEGIAHVVGTRTPGEVLGAANFHVGGDYHLRMPVTAWYTAKDQLIEGGGVEPDTEQANTIESLVLGRDLPMEKAQAVLQAS
jgi:C-terminal processing protease CtpA/Prc